MAINQPKLFKELNSKESIEKYQIRTKQYLSQAKTSLFSDFVVERMHLFHIRQTNKLAISRYDALNKERFTNPYRMLDRVSQHMIHNIVDRDIPCVEKLFRIYLFRVFNQPSTYDRIVDQFNITDSTRLSNKSTITDNVTDIVNFIVKLRAYKAVFRRAYRRAGSPYNDYLWLLKEFHSSSKLMHELLSCTGMYDLFKFCRGLNGFGKFLAYQLAIDFWYTGHFGIDMDFVVPGPGAIRGLENVYGEKTRPEVVAIMHILTDNQYEWLTKKESNTKTPQWVPFQQDKQVYRLQLNDVQNLFCEFSKFYNIHVMGARPARPLNSFPTKLNIVVPSSIIK